MVYDKVDDLIRQIQDSTEFQTYQAAKEKAMQNETTRALIKEYHQLQLQAQAAALSGNQDQTLMQKLQKLGELLQFDPAASAYLLSEYQINQALADIYKRLANAVGISLDLLEG